MAFVAGATFGAPAFAQTVPSHAAPGGGIAGPIARVTWSNQIVRILQNRCQTCHHDGGIAPFPLMTYADARDHRVQMQIVTASRQMPPWRVDSSCTAFADDPSLTPDEIRAFSLWTAAGSPEGDAANLPPPRTFSSDWALGDPDLVLATPEPFKPDFSKGDVYRCFVLPTGFAEDRFFSAIEFKPSQPAMVHHVIAYLDPSNTAPGLDQADPGPGYSCFGGPGTVDVSAISAWVPGNRVQLLPDGVGIYVPKGANIVIQVHFSARSGVDNFGVIQLGLHAAKTPVKKRWLWLPLLNDNFVLPAGQADCAVDLSFTVATPFHLLGMTPHMHLLGRTMKADLIMPDGARACGVKVPDWDLRWQDTYRYPGSIPMPVGASVAVSATYDNSDANPNNPNMPPKDVRWGEFTTDEMCLLYLHVTLDDEDLTKDASGLGMPPRVFTAGPTQLPAPRRPKPGAP